MPPSVNYEPPTGELDGIFGSLLNIALDPLLEMLLEDQEDVDEMLAGIDNPKLKEALEKIRVALQEEIKARDSYARSVTAAKENAERTEEILAKLQEGAVLQATALAQAASAAGMIGKGERSEEFITWLIERNGLTPCSLTFEEVLNLAKRGWITLFDSDKADTKKPVARHEANYFVLTQDRALLTLEGTKVTYSDKQLASSGIDSETTQ
ncbi:hypothetical protein HOG48_01290 [Candidatus Peregrinibacteria bacterium]|nr:hypothetical protein [Candidatus Peregrinibacteria bacterium]